MNLLNNITKALIIVIALAFTVTISRIVPEKQFQPYQLSLDSTWAKTPGNQEYIVDIDDDRCEEKVLHRNINQSGHSLEFFNNDGLPEVHIFDKNEFFISKYLKFHDLNMDHLKEVLFVTVINRMAYLNIISYPMEGLSGSLTRNVSKIRIDSISNYNTLPDVINFDMAFGESEVFFDLQAGYSANPRNIYKYNFRTKKLIKTSKNSIVNQKLELAEIGKKKYLLAKNVIASGNTVSPEILELLKNSKDNDSLRFYEILKRHVYEYGDFSSYILLYNDSLKFAFEPIEFFGWTNFTKSEFISINGIPNIIALTNTQEGDVVNKVITLCDLQGNIVKQLPIPKDYAELFTANGMIVFKDKENLFVYSDGLELIKQIPGITHSAGFLDINSDEESEFVALRDNEMLVFSPDFNISARFTISQEFAPYPEENGISLIQIGDRQGFVFNTRLFYYLFSYHKNHLAIFKYPFYIVVFFLWFGLLLLILKLNSKRLQNENIRLEKIVSDRTVELRSKNNELAEQKEEIQTQAEEITRQYERLEKLDQFKETLTHALVHDLKNPLSQILLNTSDSAVNLPAKKMLRLITNMLDVEKYEKAGFILNKETHWLRNIITEVINGQEAGLKEKNLEVQLHFTDFKIMADKEMMIRVFDNLLSNAVRYSPLNRSIDVFAEPSGDGMLHISMKNYGDPIPEESLPLIFDKYRHFGKTEGAAHRSTGLGLTFCKMAVEAHGGKIGAHNNPDEGCSFWLTMKAISQNAKQVENETNLPDLKPILTLTKTEKVELKEVVNKMKEFRIFEISRFHEVLDPLKATAGSNVNEWISRLFSAINIQNIDEYNRLINLVEDEQAKNTDR
jgi:signal transduction histidine kinase